jgi:L-lactate dehydrogenase (cytochrome)
MTVLYEMRQVRPDLLERYQVFIDGGVTRGTDVLKALCLGARAVGLGRAFLYGNSVWGEEGCMRVIKSKGNDIKRRRKRLIMGQQFFEKKSCWGCSCLG